MTITRAANPIQKWQIENLQLIDEDIATGAAIATAKLADASIFEWNTNKSTNIITDGASDIRYPSAKAVKTYVNTELASADALNVHKAGTETITGAKTFSNEIVSMIGNEPQLRIISGLGYVKSELFLTTFRGESNQGLKVWTDRNSASSYIDNLYNSDGCNIYLRTKVVGSPTNAVTIYGSGKVEISNHLYLKYNLGVQSPNPNHMVEVGTVGSGIPGVFNLAVQQYMGAAYGNQILYLASISGGVRIDAYDYGADTPVDIGLGGNGGSINMPGSGVWKNNGNVGIGCPDPESYKLKVNGVGYFATSLTTPTINLTTGAAINKIWQCTNATTGSGQWATLTTNQTWRGTWDASTNTPTLSDATGTLGDQYTISVAASRDLGSGLITWPINGSAAHNGLIWQMIPAPVITGAALTKTDDTNVTLTLGGSAATSLVNAASITVGWTGTLADARIASASDWNAKQAALSGTGFVKISGTTVSYDNSTYSTDIHSNITALNAVSGTNTGDDAVNSLYSGLVTFPGFGTSHSTSAYGDHNHSGVYEVPLTFGTGLTRTGNIITATGGSGLSGSGTANYIPKFTDASVIGNSILSVAGSDNLQISTYKPTGVDGFNVWIGGGGQSSVMGNLQVQTGSRNTSIGSESLLSNTSGYANLASGFGSLYSNTTGYGNSVSGKDAGHSNTTGYGNSIFGYGAFYSVSTGSNNVIIGAQAGNYYGDGYALYNQSTSVFIGAASRAGYNNGTNEIVIGVDAVGHGSNTATWGNTSMVNHYFTGNLNGTAFVKIGGTSSQYLMADGSVSTNSGSMVYPSAGIAVSTGSAWGTSITNNSANWNTAYGWGNHATVGYVTGTPWTSMGYLTGITSGQVTGALGFTPYSNANPSGYITTAGARSAISLTTNGTSGASSYDSSTGVLNIPQYAGGGSMTWPSAAGIAVYSGSSSWGSSITDNSANWNTAYTDRNKWDGGSTGLVAATGRTSLGLYAEWTGTLAAYNAIGTKDANTIYFIQE